MALNDVVVSVTSVNSEGSINSLIGGSPKSNYEAQIKEVNALGIENLERHGISLAKSASTHDIMSEIANIGSFRYAKNFKSVFRNAKFPEGYSLQLYFEEPDGDMEHAFHSATGIKKIKFVGNKSGRPIYFNYAFAGARDLEVIDFSEFNAYITKYTLAFSVCTSLKEVKGVLRGTPSGDPFRDSTLLEEVRFEEGILINSLSFASCPNLSDESIESIVKSITKVTNSKTLTFNSVVTEKLTEEQLTYIFDNNWVVQ